MITPRLVLALPALAAIALVATHCAIDPFCEDGTAGCAADPCRNQQRDGDETDVDCGGSCGPCASGAVCAGASDCASARCFEGACCDPPCVVSAQSFGGPAFDRVSSAVHLADGTLVIAGETRGTLDLGGDPIVSAGRTDVLVAALAPDGALRWQRRFGGNKEDFGPLLAVAPNGHLWLAGHFQSAKLDTGAGVLTNSGGYADLFVVELDEGGGSVQAKALRSQGTSVSVGDIAATADGGLVLTGNLGRLDFGDGTVLVSTNGPFPGGPVDVYAAKLDAHLDRVWHRQLGNADNDFNYGVELDPAGDVVVGVLSSTETSFGGPPLEKAGLALVAYANADGAYRWGRSYGRGIPSAALSIDIEGNILLLGELAGEADLGTGKLLSTGSRDAFVARLGGNGDPVWVTTLPATIESYPLAVRRDPGGGIFAAIGLTGDLALDGGVTTETGADSLVFVRLDDGGRVEWARNVGGIMVGTGALLGATPSGLVLAYGGYAGSVRLGAIPAAQGTSDAFIATLLP